MNEQAHEAVSGVVKSLGLLISDPPGSGPFIAGILAASAALIRGEWVGMYLLDEAVQGVGDGELTCLRTRGLHLFACSHAARVFGMTVTSEAVFGGLSMLGELIAKVSRFAHAGPLGTVVHAFDSGSSGRLRRVLIQVTGDPRASHKPAESVRSGVGLEAWSQVEVNFCFAGQSSRVFGNDWTGLLGEDVLEKYVPSLLEWPRPLYLSAPTTNPEGMEGRAAAGGRFVMLTAEKLGTLEAEHDVLLRL